MHTTSRDFPQLSRGALGNATLRASLTGVETHMPGIRQASVDALPDFEGMRTRAVEIRDRALAGLDEHLAAFEQRVTAAGGTVHRAASGAEACRIISQLCASAAGESAPARVLKSKSMVTEEIELNDALEAAGMQVTETDLGEYIIQLRGERPSHITAPSLHVSLDQVREAFRAHHDFDSGRDLSDTDQMLAEARQVLRERFTAADVGITGANFLVAETGAAVIVTNEGNADLTATLPDTHIVVTGIEKVVPTLDDVGVLLRLLARSAIGERLTNYTSFVHGPRRDDEISGPRNYHVVLVDNGRRDLLGTEFEPMLRCIRCAACINHCPVYLTVGGHAYGSVYPGPMGAVLTPALVGIGESAHLPNASTFCGRCESVCPVGIPLVKLMRHWRERQFSERFGAPGQRWGLAAWQFISRRPSLYRALLAAAGGVLRFGFARDDESGSWIERLPGPAAAWTRFRDLRAPAGGTFQARWRKRRGPGR